MSKPIAVRFGSPTSRCSARWLTVSPKPHFHGSGDTLAGTRELRPHECKVIVDDTVDAEALARWEAMYSGKKSPQLFLQPCWGDDYERSLARTLELIQRHPRWRLSVQLHKLVGLP